ncbi:MAG: Gfo/Idh/MocA family oxidoreductase [Eubacteriales bacterium]
MADNILNKFMETQAEETKVDASKKLKVGIIGTGWIAEAHMVAYSKCPDVEVVAAADLIPGKAEAFFEDHCIPSDGVRFYLSHKDMLDNEELDAVSVCTYNMAHAECTIYALNKGVNVMLEKPMCVTLVEAVEICRAEKKSGKVLTIGFQPRFDENTKMIKRIVESGELGQVYYIQTGGGRRRGIPTPFGTSFIAKETAGIGALGDIGCYSLDMVLDAVGNPKPLTATGYKSDFFGKNPLYMEKPEYAAAFAVDDFAAGFVRFEGGIVLDFKIAWAMHMDSLGDTMILGTKAGMKIKNDGQIIIYHDVAGERVETLIPKQSNNGKDPFDLKIRYFLDAIKNGTPSPIPSSQIIYNQAIIDGICRSAELGEEVKLVFPEI